VKLKPQTDGRHIWRLIKLTSLEWWNDDTPRFAAALAFYTLFSLAPLLLLAMGAASFFYVPALAAQDIVERVQGLVGGQGALAVGEVLRVSVTMGKSVSAVAVGIVTFILGASVIFGELQAALNKIWDVRPVRGGGVFFKAVTSRLRSFAIAMTTGLLFVVSLIANTIISHLQNYSGAGIPGIAWFWSDAESAVSFVVIVILFAIIYKYLPDVRLDWRDVWMGSLVTSILFVAGKYAIGIYLSQSTIASTFGPAGSLAILLVWVYYSALISFFGAEFTQVYAKQRGKTIQPENHAVHAGRKPGLSRP